MKFKEIYNVKKEIAIAGIMLCLLIVASTFFIVTTIQKHSVHPKFGNYVKVQDGHSCQPWDSCKK